VAELAKAKKGHDWELATGDRQLATGNRQSAARNKSQKPVTTGSDFWLR
jgi:hypothetical protein